MMPSSMANSMLRGRAIRVAPSVFLIRSTAECMECPSNIILLSLSWTWKLGAFSRFARLYAHIKKIPLRGRAIPPMTTMAVVLSISLLSY